MTGKSVVERAFELAKSGKCANLADVRRRLGQEGYQPRDLFGRTLKGQLVRELKAAAGRADQLAIDPESGSQETQA